MEPDKLSLRDRVAIVTGSGRGIGKAIALTFADAGAHLVIIARTREQVEATAHEVRAKGRKALALVGDVSQGEVVQELVDKTVKEFGRIDILVNNAGIGKSRPFLEFTEELWDEQAGNRLRSVFLCTQAVARVMARQKRGAIVNICGSPRIARRFRRPLAGYRAAVAGAEKLTSELAIELAPYGIRANAISPGWIATERVVKQYATGPEVMGNMARSVPLGRWGTPEEIAWAALFLASDASEYITGETIHVDGGPGI